MNVMSTTGSSSLVSSGDVNGTAVYSREGTHIGTIDHLMIDKQSGKVAYAVIGFGGFLGLGEDHHPVPWGKLTYDVNRNSFVTDLSEAEVQGAPERHDGWQHDREWEQRMHEHYAAPFYWM